MSQPSAITEEVKALLGKESKPEVWEVNRQWLRQFAEAIDDPNPLWQEEKYARKTRYGGIIAPPTFLTALRNEAIHKPVFEMEHPLKRMLNGGNELEFFELIRPGDVITVTGKLVDAREREGKTGKMLILILELTYKNQLDQVVAKGRNTLIRY